MTDSQPLVSVLIPHVGPGDVLGKCLDSLSRQTYRHFETIVLVNGLLTAEDSSDREKFPWVRWIFLGENLGFARAVNKGLRLAHGNLIALVNNDVVLDTHWMDRAVAALGAHPEAGFCATKILDAAQPQKILSAGDGITSWGQIFSRGANCLDGAMYGVQAEVFGACAAAAMYRVEIFRTVGDLDENFFCYAEDVDFSMRARLRGISCRYVPEAVAMHALGNSSKFLPKSALYYGTRNTMWLWMKNMPRRHVVRSGPKVFFFGILRMLRMMVHGGPWRDLAAGWRDGWLHSPYSLWRPRRDNGGNVRELLRENDREFWETKKNQKIFFPSPARAGEGQGEGM